MNRLKNSMNKLNILFLSDVSSVSFVQKLNDEFTVFYRVEDLKYEEFFKIDIIWSHLGFKIDCEFICKFPNVKYVICLLQLRLGIKSNYYQ